MRNFPHGKNIFVIVLASPTCTASQPPRRRLKNCARALLSGDVFERDGGEMQFAGLYVDLPAWRFYFLRFQSDQDSE